MPLLSHLMWPLAQDHSLLLASSFLTMTPQTSPLFDLTTLPILIHSASTQSNHGIHVTIQSTLLQISILTVGSASRSSFTTRSLLPSSIEAISSQTVFSLLISVIIVLIVKTQPFIDRLIPRDPSGWVSSALFGWLWGLTWEVWSRLSPFGRYGIPTANQLEGLGRLLRIVGPTGLDIVTGMAAHLLACAYKDWTSTNLSQGSLISLPDVVAQEPSDNTLTQDGRVSASSTPASRQSIDQDFTPSEAEALRDHRVTDIITRKEALKSQGYIRLACSLLGPVLILLSLPEPPRLSLSSSFRDATPFTIGCALPNHPQVSVEEAVLALQHIANGAQLLVLPEGTLSLKYADERTKALEKIRVDVCSQYGVHVAVNLESMDGSGKWINEAILVGPHGVEGSYIKNSLFPLIETHRFERGEKPPPVWRIDLPHPHGITKPKWSSTPPFTRPLHATPLICLDSMHPRLVPLKHPQPNVLVIPAASEPALSNQVILQAQILSASYVIPSIVCSTGVSAQIDEWGRITHRQDGGKGFTAHFMMRWYGDGSHREETLWAKIGPIGVLSMVAVSIMIGKLTQIYRKDGARGVIQTLQGGKNRMLENAKEVRKLLTWKVPEEAADEGLRPGRCTDLFGPLDHESQGERGEYQPLTPFVDWSLV